MGCSEFRFTNAGDGLDELKLADHVTMFTIGSAESGYSLYITSDECRKEYINVHHKLRYSRY